MISFTDKLVAVKTVFAICMILLIAAFPTFFIVLNVAALIAYITFRIIGSRQPKRRVRAAAPSLRITHAR